MKGSGKPRENFLSGPTNFCLSNSGGKASREKFSLSIFTILASPPTLITFTPTHLMTFAHKSYHFFFWPLLNSHLPSQHTRSRFSSPFSFFFFQRDLLFLVVIILLIHLLFLVDFLVSDDIQFFYIITIKIII